MSNKLQDYLLDDDLYKTITVHAENGEYLIKMTLGGMLERIEEVAQSEQNQQVVREAREALERAQNTMEERYYQRLAREAKSYTDSWKWFLQNCWEGDERCRTEYAQEVPLRLRLERLLEAGQGHAELADTLLRVRQLDEQLKQLWQPADEPIIDGDYDRTRYWWLYGRPEPREE